MKIETKFSCGDRIYIVDRDTVVGPFLIGQVRVVYVAAQDGPDPESYFRNIGRQIEHYEESYMCFETGVASGYVYNVHQCFATQAEAMTALHEGVTA